MESTELTADPLHGPKFPAALAAEGLAAYLIINALCVFVPFIPGIGVFLFWGLIFPSSAIVATWTWFGKSGRRMGTGLPAVIVLTVVFATAGLLTLRICIDIYNAI